jgi:hypothetical protein
MKEEPVSFVGKEGTTAQITEVETNNPSWNRTHILRIDCTNLHSCSLSRTKLKNI